MSDIKMRSVAGSSAIKAEGYDPATKQLHIHFSRAGAPTVIENVDAATYREFLASESKGKFFHERLKP